MQAAYFLISIISVHAKHTVGLFATENCFVGRRRRHKDNLSA